MIIAGNRVVYINGRFLSKPMSGIPRFAYENMVALSEMDVTVVVVAPRNINEFYDLSKMKVISGGIGSNFFWEQIWLPLILMFNYNSPLLISFSGLGQLFYKNQVITIHDMSPFVNDKWFSRLYKTYYRIFTPYVASRCKRILTVSEFSKSEIIKYMSIIDKNVSVIYNAVSENFNQINSSIDIDISEFGNYVLAVSSLDPRKNFKILIEAARYLDDDIKILVVGSSNDKVFKNTGLTNDKIVKFIGYVSDEKLKVLYANAKLFVYPSIYEGFGIPPLEAISFNCPILLSNIPVLKEIYGDAGEYFDPYDPKDLANKINSEMINHKIASIRLLQYKKLLNTYSWKNSATTLLAVLEEINTVS